MAIIRSRHPVPLDRELFELGLDPITFRVYAQLCYLAETSNSNQINNVELTQKCNISQTQYKRALSVLVRQGLLEKIGKNYEITDVSEWGTKSAKEKLKVAGYAYVAQAGLQFKIGKSKNPQRRLIQLSTGSPNQITLICTIATDDMTATELELHQRFADKRIRGEWFALSQDDLEALRAMGSNQMNKLLEV